MSGSNILPKINVFDYLAPMDWLVFFLVLALTLSSVVYGYYRKNTHSEEENFLDLLIMGRKLTLPLFIGTLVATWYGGIFGVTRIAFEYGLYNLVTQGFFWYISYILFALFLLPKISIHSAQSMPEMIEQMFGPKAGRLTAIFNLINVMPIAYVISLGLFLKMLFGGDANVMMALGLVIVLSYSSFGGFRAVVYSDFIQFFVMCLSVAIVFFTSILTFGGLEFLQSHLPSTHFSITGGNSWAELALWGFVAMATLIDPNFYQRCFAASSKKVAKKGILISTFIWFCFDICTTFGAMYARAVIPSSSPSTAYMDFSIQILPAGLRGFFIAGILATILSTLDSYLFLASTTFSYDLLPKKYKTSKMAHYISLFFIALVTYFLALSFDGNIRQVWKILGTYFASGLLIPVLHGHLFPENRSEKIFIIASVASIFVVTIWNLVEMPFNKNIDSLYPGMLTGLLILCFSHLKQKKQTSVVKN